MKKRWIRLANGWTVSLAVETMSDHQSCQLAVWPTTEDNMPASAATWYYFGAGDHTEYVYYLVKAYDMIVQISQADPPKEN